MRSQLPLEIPNLGLISQGIIRAWQELQPDRIELQSPQPEHPLQRNGKISAAFAILRRKPAAEEDCHSAREYAVLPLLPSASSRERDVDANHNSDV